MRGPGIYGLVALSKALAPDALQKVCYIMMTEWGTNETLQRWSAAARAASAADRMGPRGTRRMVIVRPGAVGA